MNGRRTPPATPSADTPTAGTAHAGPPSAGPPSAGTDRRDLALLVLASLAAGAAAVGVIAAALQPSRHDLVGAALLVTAPVLGALAAALLLRWWIARARGVVRVLLAVAAVSAVLVTGAVALAAWRMFLSAHDATIVGSVVALAAVLAVLVAWHVTRPLAAQVRLLGEVAQRVAAGDLTGRTGIDRHDELGGAGRALDHMVNRLALAEDGRERLENERAFLLSAIGHDLRTPLAALRATVESLQDGVAPDPDRYLAAMGTQLDAVEQLIDELVVYARIEAGKFEFERGEVDLAELVDETVQSMTPVAHRRGLELRASSTERVIALGGAAELSRVLRNLIDNALRYGPTGSTVRVTLAAGPHTALITVADDGPGFPDDFRPRAFEPFTRADPARDRATGTAGLGLAIARGIVDAHGGSITLGPPPGGVVELHVPLAGRRRRRPSSLEVPT